MKLHNYTPHKVRVFKTDGQFIELESEGVARVEERYEDVYEKDNIQYCKQVDDSVSGLPPEVKQGHLIIVSSRVLINSKRKDLVAPTNFVVNEHGTIVGCRKLKINE